MKAKVSLVKCSDYTPALVQGAIQKAIDLLGKITDFVSPASKVLIKPNLLMAKEPEYGITTHPEVVRAVIKILKSINCRVFLGDGPSVWGNQIENVDEVYERTGMRRVCAEEGAELVRFEKWRWRRRFPLTVWLDECDYFISLSKFKTHDFTILTGAIKNLFGLVSGVYKTVLHKKYFEKKEFAQVLVDIYQEAPPALTIVDGILAMEGDGPGTSGKLRHSGIIVAGSDAVAIDSILALVMGLNPLDILTTKEASRRGLGVADRNSILLLGEKLEQVIGQPFVLPSTSIEKRIPRPLIDLARKLIHFYPRVLHANCTRCQACIAACPEKIISLRANRIVIAYSRCISCFCCQEACPASAIRVKKTFFARMIGL